MLAMCPETRVGFREKEGILASQSGGRFQCACTNTLCLRLSVAKTNNHLCEFPGPESNLLKWSLVRLCLAALLLIQPPPAGETLAYEAGFFASLQCLACHRPAFHS